MQAAFVGFGTFPGFRRPLGALDCWIVSAGDTEPVAGVAAGGERGLGGKGWDLGEGW